MSDTTSTRRTAPRHRRRAAGLGAALTTTALVGSAALAWAGAASWPGWGAVEPAAALLTVVLGLAAALLGWVAWVLGHATAQLRRTPLDPGASQVSPAVRAATALLVGATSLGGLPAHAAPVGWTAAASAPVAPQAAATPAATASAATDAPEVTATPDVAATSQDPAPQDAAATSQDPAPQDETEPRQDQMAAPPDEAAPPHDDASVPQPGWTPTPAPGPTPRAATTDIGLVSTAVHESLPTHVVVHRGDTLWGLAARHLGPDATLGDVAEEWPRWYAANRDTIGPDPDLILPGQELVVPAPGAGR